MNRRRVLFIMLLLGGIFLAGDALLGLGRTAFFVHKAEIVSGVVTDARERPFEGWGEMLTHGNFPWEGNIAYRPIVRFSIDGHAAVADRLPDLDTHAYPNGERVELLYHRPTASIRINRFHLLWGGDLIQLAGGCILTLLMRRFLRRKKHHRDDSPASDASPRKPAKPETSASSKRRRNSSEKKTAKAASGSGSQGSKPLNQGSRKKSRMKRA